MSRPPKVTHIVSGKTWEHRDKLQSMRGLWNRDRKHWEFFFLTQQMIAELRALPGLLVQPVKPEPTPFNAIDDLENAPKSSGPSRPSKHTNLYGDEKRWLNHFADQKPTSFFGFSSLNAMCNFIDAIPSAKRDGERGNGWQHGSVEWCGTPDMATALRLARQGWPEGVQTAQEIAERLAGQNATQRRRKHSVAGGSVNVGRMLSGNPSHMISRPKQPGRKVITLFVEASMSAGVKAENAILRASIIGAVADVLEMSGYSCEIVTVDMTRGNDGRKAAVQIVVTLKHAGEPLNLNDVVFALGHPSFLRRMCFACVGSCDDLSYIHETMGKTTDAFDNDHPTEANELYISQIYSKHQSQIDKNAPLLERAMQIWKLVNKGNVPVTIEGM